MNTPLLAAIVVAVFVLIGIVTFTRNDLKPSVLVELDVATETMKLDEQTKDGHVYTLMVVVDPEDQADFVALYKDMEFTGGEDSALVSYEDALWYAFVYPPKDGEFDIERQTVSISPYYGSMDTYQLPPSIFE